MELVALLAEENNTYNPKAHGCTCSDTIIMSDRCDFCHTITIKNTKGEDVSVISWHEMMRRIQNYPALEARVDRLEEMLKSLDNKL